MANAKGAVLVGPIKFLRKRRSDALPLLAPELRHYLDDEVRLSGWYPEADFVALIRAAARLVPGSEQETIEAMGAVGAREHADIYGDLMRTMKSSSSVFALWTAQHDTGELRGVREGPSCARIELVGFDSSSEVHCWLGTGYIRGGLEMNGLEDVRVEKLQCVLRGDALCAWRARWGGEDEAPVSPVRPRGR